MNPLVSAGCTALLAVCGVLGYVEYRLRFSRRRWAEAHALGARCGRRDGLWRMSVQSCDVSELPDLEPTETDGMALEFDALQRLRFYVGSEWETVA